MRNTLIKTARILLFLSAGIFLLVVAFRDISLQDLVAGLRSANYLWVLLSLLFAFVAFLSRAYRWILLIEPLGYKPSAKNTFYALMTGYLANFLLPRIGEITRCGSLNRTDRIPADALFGTVITERITDIIALLVLTVMVMLIRIGFFGTFFYNYIIIPIYIRISLLLSAYWPAYIIAAGLILVMLAIYFIPASRLPGRFRLVSKIKKIIRQVGEGMKSVVHMRRTRAFLLHTVFIWLMYYLMTWALFMALPATSRLDGTAVLFVLVIGGFGMAAPVQAGIGAYHWIVSVGLGIYGISREAGLVFATLSHESQSLLMIVLGAFSLLMVFLESRKKSAASAPAARHTGAQATAGASPGEKSDETRISLRQTK